MEKKKEKKEKEKKKIHHDRHTFFFLMRIPRAFYLFQTKHIKTVTNDVLFVGAWGWMRKL